MALTVVLANIALHKLQSGEKGGTPNKTQTFYKIKDLFNSCKGKFR